MPMLMPLSLLLAAPAAQPSLWYAQPAERWTEALPVGNGRLGAMVFGGVGDGSGRRGAGDVRAVDAAPVLGAGVLVGRGVGGGGRAAGGERGSGVAGRLNEIQKRSVSALV
jgi:hypothetical protein